MKKITLYLLTSAFTGIFYCALHAQPVITSANIPIVGDSVIIAICSDPVNPGPEGAAQTWDMSSLNETFEGYFKFVAPSSTMWDYHFPDATICGRSWENSYAYYKSTPTTFEQLGACLIMDTVAPPNDTAKSINSNPEKILNLPFNFGNMFSDDFDGTNYAFGFTQAFEGDINVEVDAYGTLILPSGTFTNVIRYHFTRNQTAAFSPPQFKEQWGWISADHRFWLLLMEELDNGFGTSTLVWYNKAPIAAVPTAISTQTKSEINIYPNPVSQNQSIYIDWNNSEEVNIEITNISGASLYFGSSILHTGANEFALSDIITTAGIYFIKISSGENQMIERLVIR